MPLPTEEAAERAYCAFVENLGELTPPVVQTWSEMHPRVRQAWIAAASAVMSSHA
jgi:hypothetical protein